MQQILTRSGLLLHLEGEKEQTGTPLFNLRQTPSMAENDSNVHLKKIITPSMFELR